MTNEPIIQFFITAFYLSIMVSSCGDKNANAAINPVMPRDTTITSANAITKLSLDRAQVKSFIQEIVKDSEKPNKIRSFYNSRNYQYAWFNEEGLMEPAESFWNLHERRLDL